MITITRTDRAYMRKWTKAHRHGMPTAAITLEWLGRLKAPKPKKAEIIRGIQASTSCTMPGFLAPAFLTPPAAPKIELESARIAYDIKLSA